MALQRGREVHRALPRRAEHLVVRVGLRRQRAAGQEVLRAAHRLGDGARRGLDGGAHADPRASRVPEGEKTLLRGGIPQRLRQDQPRDAGAAARRATAGRSPRWATTSPGSGPGADGRLLRHQPRGGILRRGPGHLGRRPTRTRWPPSAPTPSSPTWRSRPMATSGGRG